MPVPVPLPIDDVLHEVVGRSREAPVVLVAPPGAGKTTRVPPALAAEVDGAVWLVEPRRVAARAAARRIASEQGERLGQVVGHHVRFDKRCGPNTRILAVTEGILLRRLQADPFLEGVGAVVFDEFHERRLDADLGLALVHACRQQVRDDLRLVVMSATLDPGPVADYLGGVGVHSEGRAYPVDVHYLPRPDERPVADVVADGVRRALRHDGDVLAFLPGARSIRWTAERLAGCGAEVVPLYGALSADAQDRALRPGAGRRVVLATNLAESSLTVPGVRTVVDAGWVKQLEHDPGTGLDRLRRVRIPVDSADQRAGRAGREAPGRCLRLWTERQQAAMAPRQLPEVARLDLAGPALQLLAWGDDPSTFAWFEVPPEHHLDAALELLDRLGARHQGRITATGRQLAALPLHPRLGVLLVEAARRGHAELGAWAAALLSERDPLSGPPEGPSTGSDLLDRVEAVRAGQGRGGARQAVAQVAKRLVGLAPRPEERVDADEALGRAVLAAWPDRVVRRRDDGVRGRMVGGKGVSLERSRVRSELLVAVDASPGSEAEVRVASPVRAAWLPTEERVVAELVGTKVSARRVVAYGDLELSSHPAPVDRRAAGQALERWGHDHPQAVQPTGEGWSQLLGRLRWARGHDQRLPEVDDELIRSLLPLVCAGKRSVAEVQSADWVGALRDTLGWPLFQRLQQLAPERIDLPKGRSAALDWSGPRPVLAVQLQRLLGLRRTPRVGDGREPVLLHLLAPNRRVAQITDDLEGFWTGSYAEVRKQLRARYPKHAWPEDPLQANG